jgi:hypothetical protein
MGYWCFLLLHLQNSFLVSITPFSDSANPASYSCLVHPFDLKCKTALFTIALFILLPASTRAGLIASNSLFSYLGFWRI